MSKAKVLKNASLSKDEVLDLVKAGAIREEFLQLTEGFASDYSVDEASPIELTSFRTNKKFEMPMFSFSNDSRRCVVWGTTLLGALVMPDDYEITSKPIAKAKGLPVYFRDDFLKEHPNLQKVSDHRDDKGGVPIYAGYEIIGAIVTRSKVEEDRWSLGYKVYERGILFLEFERLRLADNSISWVAEDRIIEISKLPKKERTYESAVGPVTLPSFSDLKIIGGADEDVRWAKAQFLFKKTW